MSSLGNKTFTRIYNTDRIYIPYQTPAPNPSHKFFLNTTQENVVNAFLIKKGAITFRDRPIILDGTEKHQQWDNASSTKY